MHYASTFVELAVPRAMWDLVRSKLNDAGYDHAIEPRLGDRYVVTIEAMGTRQICSEDGSIDDITGHVRGAPRMHWRRGHFRTLWRGTDREQIVPVAPCLVSANDAADPIRNEYRVRSSEVVP